LWPEPLIQLNPAFEPGESIGELVARSELHPECSRIFRRKLRPDAVGDPLRLHRHQSEAVRVARTVLPYVLTTGTGSGKSLAYIVPAVDHVLRRGSGRGIQAIIVYPMNALANSQRGELEKYLCHGYPAGSPPVRFARYTGQESFDERKQIQQNPPDILLTNYVMLELLLTRPEERRTIWPVPTTPPSSKSRSPPSPVSYLALTYYQRTSSARRSAASRRPAASTTPPSLPSWPTV
jgi:ATP-dependent helicase YprA (DUF1998 family)